ncbi:MAG: penicillin-binding protein activator LpoB [Bacteriovoracaceae bacterium]|nr:penicillin-binding protein activator LpoB [Bacteriovoracaceae bacterium]
MDMRNAILSLSLLFVFGANFISCGPKAFTKGGYDDPNKVILLDDKFNENDMQLISNQLVDSLTKFTKIQNAQKPPVVMVGRVRNRTSEHIDVKSLTDKIRTALIKSQKFSFSDKESRDELAEEYEYNAGKFVDKKSAKAAGKQVGADYLITGDIASNVQEVGDDKIVYYKVTLNLNNLETNIIEWSDDKEVRKRYRKQSVGF